MNAIVYTSNSGFTAQYAEMLGGKPGLPVYALTDAPNRMGKAIAPIKRTLAYWGVPYRKGYGIAVSAMRWEQVPQRKQDQIEKDMTALAEKVKKARVGKPSPLIRFLFRLMASAKKSSKAGDYDAEEARYWRENGWLDGKMPWR